MAVSVELFLGLVVGFFCICLTNASLLALWNDGSLFGPLHEKLNQFLTETELLEAETKTPRTWRLQFQIWGAELLSCAFCQSYHFSFWSGLLVGMAAGLPWWAVAAAFGPIQYVSYLAYKRI